MPAVWAPCEAATVPTNRRTAAAAAACLACDGDAVAANRRSAAIASLWARWDAEVVPMWDFKLVPGAPKIRDASAASVAVCGFQELLKQGVRDPQLTAVIQKLLARLCSPQYLDHDPACPGLQKFCMVGAENKSGKSAYTSWGDYFLMEALARELELGDSFW